MSKTKRLTFTDDCRQEAARFIATSGRTLPQGF